MGRVEGERGKETKVSFDVGVSSPPSPSPSLPKASLPCEPSPETDPLTSSNSTPELRISSATWEAAANEGISFPMAEKESSMDSGMAREI